MKRFSVLFAAAFAFALTGCDGISTPMDEQTVGTDSQGLGPGEIAPGELPGELHPPFFSLALSPPRIELARGHELSLMVNIVRAPFDLSSFGTRFEVLGAPRAISANFLPNVTYTDGAVLTLGVGPKAALGTRMLMVRGTGATGSASIILPVTILESPR